MFSIEGLINFYRLLFTDSNAEKFGLSFVSFGYLHMIFEFSFFHMQIPLRRHADSANSGMTFP
ncbi:MAG: hypothetical protein MJ098_03680, partial [Saccharofermentans sp.]|nr:hypothetical protein [Saccharofermentans sp.]